MPDRTLYQWFTGSVERYPDHPAVEVNGAGLTYRALHACALAIAARIVAQHGGPPRRIALLAARSLVAFAGYLAALRLGATVIPLNPSYPSERNRRICELAGADMVLADEPILPQLGAERNGLAAKVLSLTDSEVLSSATASEGLPPFQVTPDDIAYILFTSGSTGRPKGVPIRHRNLSPYISHSIARYNVGPECRMSHTFDLTFDPSVFDLFVTWGGGATLVAAQRTELLTPVDYLVNNQITHWFSAPSVVSVSAGLGNLPTGLVRSLRYSLFIGERLTYGQVQAWRAVAPESVIENVYGPTELTVACTEYRLPRDPTRWPVTSNDTVPIGPVFDYLDFLVLDEQHRHAAEGELCVRGPQRFSGYLDPADNVGRFLTYDGTHAALHDGTGELTDSHYYRTGDRVRLEAGGWVHLGRLDNQVKIRGYRVELGEIEATLCRHPNITQAVVIPLEHGTDIELIGCYTGHLIPPRT